MTSIAVLSPGFTSPNGAAFLFPLFKFRSALRERDIEVRFYQRYQAAVTAHDVVLLDNKYYKWDWDTDAEGTLRQIEEIGKATRLVWCDTADSTGTFLGQVLPYVRRYAKAQLLRDHGEYTRVPYGSRPHTDYYYRKLGITDTEPYIAQPAQNPEDLQKLTLSWNSGLMNYGWISPYMARLREKLPLNLLLHFSKLRVQPTTARPLDITARMGISYKRETVCYQRRRICELLAEYVPTNKLSRRQYFRELERSKLCVSPFGLGEITLKDFECFLCGSLLFKPDMSHMETWPDFFEKNVTYAAHSWDLDDVPKLISYWLEESEKRLEIAHQGQQRYLEHTTGLQAGHLFAEHLESLVENA